MNRFDIQQPSKAVDGVDNMLYKTSFHSTIDKIIKIILQELQGVDVLHKFNWIRLISRMFEAMAGNFAHPEDIQLFLNVLNGSMALHAGDSVILRYCMATIINATHQFKNIFNTSGYLLIMPSIVQIYSNNLSNHLVTSAIEHLVKQLYILHR